MRTPYGIGAECRRFEDPYVVVHQCWDLLLGLAKCPKRVFHRAVDYVQLVIYL